MNLTGGGSWLAIRLRSAAALAILAVVLPVAAGLWGISVAQDAVVERVREGQSATASALAAHIEESIAAVDSFLIATAVRPLVVDAFVRGDVEELEVLLQNASNAEPAVLVLVLVDAAGDVVAAHPADVTRRPPATSRPVGDDAHFGRGAALTAPDGVTIGRLEAMVSLRRLESSIPHFRFGTTGSVTVVDRDGRVLLTGEPRRVGRRLVTPENVALLRSGVPGTTRYVGRYVGREEMAALVPLDSPPWAVLVTQATSEALAGTDDLRRLMLAGLAGLVALGLLIVFLLAQALRNYERRLREEIDEQARLVDEQRRLNAALEDYGRHVAHDLRGPLATVTMATRSLARARSLDPIAREQAEIAGRAAERAIDFVEDLLLLARASGTPTPEPVDVFECARTTAEGLDVSIDVRGTSPVVADRVAVSQAVANLVRNAATYGRTDGACRVDVTVEEVDEGWRISVADRGPGLAPGDEQRVFAPLVRGATSTGTRGTGLGLAIVAKAAEAHGGRAWYEPRPGGGSTFSIYLPRSRNGAWADRDARSPHQPSEDGS